MGSTPCLEGDQWYSNVFSVFNYRMSHNRLVGGLEVLSAMEQVATDEQDKPQVRGQPSIALNSVY